MRDSCSVRFSRKSLKFSQRQQIANHRKKEERKRRDKEREERKEYKCSEPKNEASGVCLQKIEYKTSISIPSEHSAQEWQAGFCPRQGRASLILQKDVARVSF